MTKQISQEIEALKSRISSTAVQQAKKTWHELKQQHRKSIDQNFGNLSPELREEISKALFKDRKTVPEALVIDALKSMELGMTMYTTFKNVQR